MPDLSDTEVVSALLAYKAEAEEARRTRLKQNRLNREAYMGQQDWSHKSAGQSTEFLPNTAGAVEQFVGFAKRALTQFGDWFDISLGQESKSPISSAELRDLIKGFTNEIYIEDNSVTSLASQIAQGLKSASLESLLLFKVMGHTVLEHDPFDKKKKKRKWRLRLDLIRQEDYYVDPSGRGLYEIVSSEHDLHYVIERAREGIYDLDEVLRLKESFEDDHDASKDSRDPQELGQDEEISPGFRKKVMIEEFWGTLLDEDGHVAYENCRVVLANERFLLRKPESNPLWHQRSPIIAVPLIRVPHSVWHKALYDHAVLLNLAQNELFNLMLDGAISAVWGIKQLRIDHLADPRDVSDGIPQGKTLQVKDTLPSGQKVLEKVAEGEIPQDSQVIFNELGRQFAAAGLTNELKLGSLPPRKVLATEVIEQSQSQAVTLDSIVGDIEKDAIEKILWLSLMTILQHLDDIDIDELLAAVGEQATFALLQMTPKMRWEAFNSGVKLQVHGLSATLARVRDFQKLAALLQMVGNNPLLLQSFFRRYSPDKILNHAIKTLNINPLQIERDDEDIARIPQEQEDMAKLGALLGPAQQQGGGATAQGVGESELPAEIEQSANPLTGLAQGA